MTSCCVLKQVSAKGDYLAGKRSIRMECSNRRRSGNPIVIDDSDILRITN